MCKINNIIVIQVSVNKWQSTKILRSCVHNSWILYFLVIKIDLVYSFNVVFLIDYIFAGVVPFLLGLFEGLLGKNYRLEAFFVKAFFFVEVYYIKFNLLVFFFFIEIKGVFFCFFTCFYVKSFEKEPLCVIVCLFLFFLYINFFIKKRIFKLKKLKCRILRLNYIQILKPKKKIIF